MLHCITLPNPSRSFPPLPLPIRPNGSLPFRSSQYGIQRSWQALRLLRSPDVATTIKDSYKCYKVPTTRDLQPWLEETFTVAETGTSVDVTIREAHEHLSQRSLCQLLPHYTDDASFKGSILLLVSHWRTEASDVYIMINQLLDYAIDLLEGTRIQTALGTHITGSEVQFLTGLLDDVLMPHRIQSRSKSPCGEALRDYCAHIPSIDFHITGNPSAPPTNEQAYQSTFTSTTTSNLTRACKANFVSVTSAQHT